MTTVLRFKTECISQRIKQGHDKTTAQVHITESKRNTAFYYFVNVFFFRNCGKLITVDFPQAHCQQIKPHPHKRHIDAKTWQQEYDRNVGMRATRIFSGQGRFHGIRALL